MKERKLIQEKEYSLQKLMKIKMFYRTLTNNRRNDLSCDFVPYDRNKEKMTKMTSKPCNTDFKILSDEAKKNGSLRYYFESNLSHL